MITRNVLGCNIGPARNENVALIVPPVGKRPFGHNIKKKSTLELQEISGTKRGKRLIKGGRIQK